MQKAWDPDRWIFDARERSAAAWEVTADDQQGTVISHVVDDPDEGLKRVRAEADEISRRRRAAAS